MLELGLAALLVLSGPHYDHLTGSQLTAADAALLPGGGHLASLADLWLLEVVSLGAASNGLGVGDPVQLSMHGRSWTSLRYFLNGLEITDPGLPGQPLLELPHTAWQRLEVRSLWSDAPGVYWHLRPKADTAQAELALVGGGAVGGGGVLPAGLLDREPALRTGATPTRRGVRRRAALTVNLAQPVPSLQAQTRLVLHHQQQRQSFPTLTSHGTPQIDSLGQTTALGVVQWRLGPLPLTVLAAAHQIGRSHDGAQNRWPAALTQMREGAAALLQIGAQWRPRVGVRLRALLGFGWRYDAWRNNGDTPPVRDLADQWLWLARPRLSETLQRQRSDGLLEAYLGSSGRTRLRLRVGQAVLRSAVVPAKPGVGWSHNGATNLAQRAVALQSYEPGAQPAEQWLHHARLGVEHRAGWLAGRWRLHAGLDLAAASTEHRGVGFVTPTAGLAGGKGLAGGEVFFLVRHEAEPLTRELTRVLDRNSPSGVWRAWLDDGDRLPESGEAGRVLSRFGPRHTVVGPHLRRPTSNHFSLGWRSPVFGPLRLVINGVGRMLLERFVVRQRGVSYRPLTLNEPGGDGLGERRSADGAPQQLAVFEQQGSAAGAYYELSNAPDPAFYLGAELRLSTAHTSWWYLSLGLAGYWNIGSAPFGLYADRNDPGVIGGHNLGPNGSVNTRGSYDHGRAFSGNLLLALTPGGLWRGLGVALVLRYRDGQPMTRIWVVEGLAQGPTAVMAVPRGQPVPRFTFGLNLDVRLRYQLPLRGLDVVMRADLLNALGSGTEVLEDVRTGASFRRSLEMVPGRTLMLGLSIGY